MCKSVCIKILNFRTQTFYAKMFVHRVDIRDPKVTRMHFVTQSVTSVVCETRVQKRDVFDDHDATYE